MRLEALALAGLAGSGRHDLPEEGPLDALHLAAAATGLAGREVGAGRGAGPGALRAEDRGVDGDDIDFGSDERFDAL